jgi:uncharacterized membrane protein YraQ (UPF0718 family)
MVFVTSVRKYVTGIIIGLIIGLWFGVNIGKDQSIFSNPFKETALTEQMKEKAQDVIKDTKRAVREKLED